MSNKKYLFIGFGLILVQLILLTYLKFTAWPEMLLWPYLMNHGWLPYANIAIAHTPLMLVKLAIFYKVFGVGILQLKLFTWILVFVLDLLVFWIGKKLWNVKIALIALGSFIVWQLFFDGNGLWFDLFMGILAFISFYFVRNKKWLLAGVFWALALISKQTAVWFLLPIGIEILQNTKNIFQKLKRFILGVILVILPFVFILWVYKDLLAFVGWAINFGIFVLPKVQGQVQLPDLKNLIISVFPFLIFIPLVWKDKKDVNLLIWAIAGILGAYPRFEYFHFQPGIPFLAVASGLVVSKIKELKGFFKIFIVFYLLGTLYLFSGFFMRNFNEGVRFYEKDVRDLVLYVKANTNAGDKIFVMNWWDNIYPLTNTMPATNPWVPQLSWYMEISGVQNKMVQDIGESKPRIIILAPYSESGLSAYIPKIVYDYVIQNYKLKEKVDNLEVLILK